jgi:hypothetical protein
VKVCSLSHTHSTAEHAQNRATACAFVLILLLPLSQVDSVNRDGVLLEMVQLLTDLDLVISKSYISSDGGWLMDGKN